jgi:hypothetical protein
MTLGALVTPNTVRDLGRTEDYHRNAVRVGIREYKSYLAGPISLIGQRLSESSEILG